MNVAFIQHSQHDVYGNDGGHNQPGLGGKRILKRGGRSLKRGVNARRQLNFLLRLLNRLVASPRETPGARLNESVTTGNWPW